MLVSVDILHMLHGNIRDLLKHGLIVLRNELDGAYTEFEALVHARLARTQRAKVANWRVFEPLRRCVVVHKHTTCSDVLGVYSPSSLDTTGLSSTEVVHLCLVLRFVFVPFPGSTVRVNTWLAWIRVGLHCLVEVVEYVKRLEHCEETDTVMAKSLRQYFDAYVTIRKESDRVRGKEETSRMKLKLHSLLRHLM
jgi:hypothetical protein